MAIKLQRLWIRIEFGVLMFAASNSVITTLSAGETPKIKHSELFALETKAVENCLSIIRKCQLPDGALQMKFDGTGRSAPVWIAPYFSNYAALSLLVAPLSVPEGGASKKPSDIIIVEKWLNWCVANQTTDGYWNDFTGTVAKYRDNGKVDAWDSSAAMFLVVVDRYRRSGGKMTPGIIKSVKSALQCIENVADDDGLTWAKPTYKVKYLMDNVEVYSGLAAGERVLVESAEKLEAEKAGRQKIKNGAALPKFWRENELEFAYALHPNGVFEGGLEKAYPHGLAQLFGAGFVLEKPVIWNAITEKFVPDTGVAAVMGCERWLVAASRLGVKDQSIWRAKVVKESSAFSSESVYVYRPAIAVMALIEGAEWMPSILSPNELSQP